MMERACIAADMQTVEGGHMTVPNATFAMRMTDIVFAITGLLFTFPLFFIIAVLIRVESRGPVFFVQKRMGLNRGEFNVIKFRTMRLDAEKDRPQWAQKNDPRVTRVGRILRRLHLDELPQIWNILRGDMALVGPRPIRACFVEELAHANPRYNYRFFAKPGLTGMAQLYAPYGSTLEEQLAKIPYDLQYFNGKFHVGKYVWVILATFWKVVRKVKGRDS